MILISRTLLASQGPLSAPALGGSSAELLSFWPLCSRVQPGCCVWCPYKLFRSKVWAACLSAVWEDFAGTGGGVLLSSPLVPLSWEFPTADIWTHQQKEMFAGDSSFKSTHTTS